MKFSYEMIEDYINQMNSISENINKSFDSIRDSFKLINNNWSGMAADNSFKKSSKLSLDFEEFSNEIKACIAYLQKCSDRYEEADRSLQLELDEIISSSKFFN